MYQGILTAKEIDQLLPIRAAHTKRVMAMPIGEPYPATTEELKAEQDELIAFMQEHRNHLGDRMTAAFIDHQAAIARLIESRSGR